METGLIKAAFALAVLKNVFRWLGFFYFVDHHKFEKSIFLRRCSRQQFIPHSALTKSIFELHFKSIFQH